MKLFNFSSIAGFVAGSLLGKYVSRGAVVVFDRVIIPALGVEEIVRFRVPQGKKLVVPYVINPAAFVGVDNVRVEIFDYTNNRVIVKTNTVEYEVHVIRGGVEISLRVINDNHKDVELPFCFGIESWKVI